MADYCRSRERGRDFLGGEVGVCATLIGCPAGLSPIFSISDFLAVPHTLDYYTSEHPPDADSLLKAPLDQCHKLRRPPWTHQHLPRLPQMAARNASYPLVLAEAAPVSAAVIQTS